MELYPPTLALLGRTRAWVVHGIAEGAPLDEISISGPTHLRVLDRGTVSADDFDTADHGIAAADVAALIGGDADANATLLTGILDGSVTGPPRDIVLANAAGALCAAALAPDFGSALELAERTLDDRKPLAVLRAMQRSS